jgi:catechol 2,3-dioxygenase-like lactoylglutathione lyase family enzyme
MYHIGYVPVKLHTGSFGDANFLVQCSSSRCAFRGHSRTLAQARVLSPTIEHMTIQQMEHVGIVVDDLAAATEFFVELGLVLQGEGPVEGRWVDRVVGLEGVRADIAMMQTPDGNGRLELTKFHSPSNQGDNRHAPANSPTVTCASVASGKAGRRSVVRDRRR